MMEQAMEDRTSFEVWEFLELAKNPVVRPITSPLVVIDVYKRQEYTCGGFGDHYAG